MAWEKGGPWKALLEEADIRRVDFRRFPVRGGWLSGRGRRRVSGGGVEGCQLWFPRVARDEFHLLFGGIEFFLADLQEIGAFTVTFEELIEGHPIALHLVHDSLQALESRLESVLGGLG